MDSQASVSSSTSTVPLDLIHDQDNDFVDEIDEVDRIYFGNIILLHYSLSFFVFVFFCINTCAIVSVSK
jgi:hypothetical protein